MSKVRITWNNEGGELDSVTVEDDGNLAITNALIDMIVDTPVNPGDTIFIEYE